MAMGCLGLHGGESGLGNLRPELGFLPFCPSPFPTLGSLRCLRWDVDLVGCGLGDSFRDFSSENTAPQKSNPSLQSDHSPVSLCVLEGRGYRLCNDTGCVMMLGQRQTLDVMVILKYYSGVGKFKASVRYRMSSKMA